MNRERKVGKGLCYVPRREVCFSLHLGEYGSFGLAVFENTDFLAYVSSISADEGFLSELARRCTNGQLSPVHLFDVIEDALGR